MKYHLMLASIFISVTDCMCVGGNDDATLLHTQIFFRHGHRAPRKTWPNDPYGSLFEGHLKELTTRGFYAAYHVGGRLREWYASLLSIDAAEDIYMRSTNSSRTLATAKALLYGLLGVVQPEPASNASLFGVESLISVLDEQFGAFLPAINTVPLTEDQMLKRSSICPRYSQLQESISRGIEAQFEARNRGVLQSLQSLTQSPHEARDGSDQTAGSLLRAAWRLFDSLYSWTTHGLPVPAALDDPVVRERLHVLAALKMRLFFVNSELLHIRSHALRNELLRNVALHAHLDSYQSSQSSKTIAARTEPERKLDAARAETGRRKHSLSLYSTHDSTLTMLLCTLQLYSCKVSSRAFLEQNRLALIPPEFASVVMIDLYLERSADHPLNLASPNYTVGVWYYSPNFPNAERVRLKLPGCSERCPLAVFLEIVRSPSEYSQADVCENLVPCNCHYRLIFVLLIAAAASLLCFVPSSR